MSFVPSVYPTALTSSRADSIVYTRFVDFSRYILIVFDLLACVVLKISCIADNMKTRLTYKDPTFNGHGQRSKIDLRKMIFENTMNQTRNLTDKRNIVKLPYSPIQQFRAGGTHLSHWFDYTTRPIFASYNRRSVLLLTVWSPNVLA